MSVTDTQLEMNQELESLGLSLIGDAITTDEERFITNLIDREQWENIYSRRTIHFGYDYSYKTRKISPSIERPSIPQYIIPKCVSDIFIPEQVIVNEYTNGQSIAQHTDANVFGPVISILSLESDTYMDLSLGSKQWKLLLPRRSLLIFKGDARYKMKHGLKFNGNRRVSITYRTIA